MRRILAVASSTALTLGLLIGVSPSASAAETNPSSVTVTYVGSPGDTTLSTTVIAGGVGDTFTVVNGFSSTGITVLSVGGSVAQGGNDCSGAPLCDLPAGISGVYTVTSLGTFNIVPASGSGLSTRSVSIVAGGSSESGSTPQVTMTFDGNGGNCSTNPIVITGAGGAAYQLPAEGSGAGQCRRDDYTLLGWAHEQDATSVDPNLGPGATVNFANAGGTMYAVWRPNGVEVVYDSNVGAADQCIRGGSNVVGDARQSAPVVLQEGRDGGVAATQAPCKPVDVQLVGWALTGDGPSVVAPGGGLPASFTRGSSYVLYAKWQVVYGLTFSAESLSMAPGQQATVTITATFNGAPATNAVVMLDLASYEQFGLGTRPVVITDAAGQAAVTVVSSSNLTAASPPTTLSAAYGNTTASVQLTPAVERSIVIEGERGEVKGKSGIRIIGRVMGLADGVRVVPYIRFPGQTTFSVGSARGPEVAFSTFAWQRLTGKRTEVYFTSEDGTVTSNTVIVPAK